MKTMKLQDSYQSISLVIAGVLAVLAMLNIWPYGFYQLVRWTICLSAIYGTYQQGSKNKHSWTIIFVFIAILFNPIAPIHFDKAIWQPIDLVVGVIMFAAYFKLRNE